MQIFFIKAQVEATKYIFYLEMKSMKFSVQNDYLIDTKKNIFFKKYFGVIKSFIHL